MRTFLCALALAAFIAPAEAPTYKPEPGPRAAVMAVNADRFTGSFAPAENDFERAALRTVVEFHGDDGFACSAVVIAPGTVVTAKHCVQAGLHTIVTRDGEFRVEGGIITQKSDAAVLYAAGVQCPCAKPAPEYGRVIGEHIVIVGHGGRLKGLPFARTAKTVNVGLPSVLGDWIEKPDPAEVPEEYLDEFNEWLDTMWHEYLWYEPLGTGGDSGGGVFARDPLKGGEWVLIGIHVASWQDTRGLPFFMYPIASGATPMRDVEGLPK
jgi:hypothetical protein